LVGAGLTLVGHTLDWRNRARQARFCAARETIRGQYGRRFARREVKTMSTRLTEWQDFLMRFNSTDNPDCYGTQRHQIDHLTVEQIQDQIIESSVSLVAQVYYMSEYLTENQQRAVVAKLKAAAAERRARIDASKTA
jgi:hypothetical protein